MTEQAPIYDMKRFKNWEVPADQVGKSKATYLPPATNEQRMAWEFAAEAVSGVRVNHRPNQQNPWLFDVRVFYETPDQHEDFVRMVDNIKVPRVSAVESGMFYAAL